MLRRPSLLENKLIPTFRAFCRIATHGRWAARASKSSTIGYVESETAFWTPNDVLGFLAQSYPFVIYEKAEKILKISNTIQLHHGDESEVEKFYYCFNSNMLDRTCLTVMEC